MPTDIYLDIETRDGFQHEHIARLPKPEQVPAIRFGLAVTSANNQFLTWDYTHPTDNVEALWQYLSGKKAGHEFEEVRVVGWNLIHFDIPVIMSAIGMDTDTDELLPFGVMDLFKMIRNITYVQTNNERWYKLGVVMEATFGIIKPEPGGLVCDLLNEGGDTNMKTVADYCRGDVESVMMLHNHLKEGKSLILPRRPERKKEYGDLAFYMDPLPRLVAL